METVASAGCPGDGGETRELVAKKRARRDHVMTKNMWLTLPIPSECLLPSPPLPTPG